MVSLVFMICDAYESGFGNGLKSDNLPSPYGGKYADDLNEAYAIGYAEGARRSKKQDQQSKEQQPSKDPSDYADKYRQLLVLWKQTGMLIALQRGKHGIATTVPASKLDRLAFMLEHNQLPFIEQQP